MEPKELDQILSFRSDPTLISLAAGNIDLEAGILRDVVMVEEGDAMGHMVSLEAEFINDLVAYDLRVYGEEGVKSRYTHPMGDGMGLQLGYYKNIRTRKKGGKMQAIGDYHLLQSAKLSPHGNLYDFVLSMAQEAPNFMMASIEFRPGRYYQKEKGGLKKYVWEYQKTKDQSGEEYVRWVSSDPKLGKVYVEFGDKGEHYYTDMVEAGAATKSLFHIAPTPTDAPASEPQKPKIKMSRKELLELLFGKEQPAEDVVFSPAQVEEMRTKLSNAETTLADAKTKLDAANASVTSLQTEVDNLKTQLSEKDKEIVALNAKIPAATPTTGPGEGGSGGGTGTQSWMKSPINQQAARIHAARNK